MSSSGRGDDMPLVNMEKKKTKTSMMFGRSTSCVTNPETSALDAVKEGNLQLLCDLLAEVDEEGSDVSVIDVNKSYPEEKHKTLLQLAAERGDERALGLLLSAGADANAAPNRLTAHTALHSAVAGKKAFPGVFRMLLAAAADVNARAAGGKTVLHMLARKCARSDDPEPALQCLRMALSVRGAEVDAADEAGDRTPLYLAASLAPLNTRSSCGLAAVRALLSSGADWSLKCGEESSIRDMLREKLGGKSEEFAELEKLNDESFGLSGKSLGSAVKQSLMTMLEEADLMLEGEDEGQLRKFREALDGAAVSDLEAKSSGEFGLVQRASEWGLPRHLRLLLRKGLDPNAASPGTAPALVLAARRGHADVLRVLRETAEQDGKGKSAADFGALDPRTGMSVLHNVLRRPFAEGSLKHSREEMEERYLQCLEVILGQGEEGEGGRFYSQLRGVINARDELDNTALHYATQQWPQTVVRLLLERGANVGMKNAYSEVPVEKILPSTMEDFLSVHCLTSAGEPTNNNFRVNIKYDFLAPPRDGDDPSLVSVTSDGGKRRREGWTAVDDGGKEEDKKSGGSNRRPPLPETEVLWHMSQSKHLRHLLVHPVVTTFLWMKWRRISSAYNKNLAFYFAFVAALTSFIFASYGGRDVVSSDEDGKTCKEKQSVHVLWWIVAVLVTILLLREILQFGIGPRRYFFSLENWLEVVLISLTVSLLLLSCSADPDSVSIARHAATAAIVLAWSEWITMVGRHPRLGTYNIYVTMFYKVTSTFVVFLLWYSFFIFPFALGFYILLHKDKEEGDKAKDNGDDENYPFFNTVWLSVVKTFTMFVGELEFGDLPIETAAGYIFFLAFIFLIVVVMMNLLNGLAVSDIGEIRREAEITAYATQVEVVSYVESMLLGDPFNFLSNWPAFVWLRRVPPCSLGSALYRVPPLRMIFHKLTGAPKVLLFYDFLPDKQVTFYPNDEPPLCRGCLGGGGGGGGGGRREDGDEEGVVTVDPPTFPREILESVKSCVLAKESSRDSLENRLERTELALAQLREEVLKALEEKKRKK